MDYIKELDRIVQSLHYWKPTKGQFKVKALTELEEAEPFVREHVDAPNEVTAQAKIKLLVDSKELTWTFGIGKTPASTYGQLVEFATKNGNSLLNKEFTVIVIDDGTRKSYTIV